MRGSTSVLERGDLIVQGLPFRAEDVRAGNDHVDFVRAGFHRAPDFRDTFLERRKAGRESRVHRGWAGDHAPRNWQWRYRKVKSVHEERGDPDLTGCRFADCRAES